MSDISGRSRMVVSYVYIYIIIRIYRTHICILQGNGCLCNKLHFKPPYSWRSSTISVLELVLSGVCNMLKLTVWSSPYLVCWRMLTDVDGCWHMSGKRKKKRETKTSSEEEAETLRCLYGTRMNACDRIPVMRSANTRPLHRQSISHCSCEALRCNSTVTGFFILFESKNYNLFF